MFSLISYYSLMFFILGQSSITWPASGTPSNIYDLDSCLKAGKMVQTQNNYIQFVCIPSTSEVQ